MLQQSTASTTPVPHDEFDDEMNTPLYEHEIAWACRVLPAEGEKLLDKLGDERAAPIRAIAARVPWMRRAVKKQFMPRDRCCQSSSCNDAACIGKSGQENAGDPTPSGDGSSGFQGHSFRG